MNRLSPVPNPQYRQEVPLPPPREPFRDWPLHIADEHAGFYLWYVEPATFVVQMHTKQVSLLTVQRLVRLVDEAREIRSTEITAAGGGLYIHDWTSVEAVDTAAHRFLQASFRKLSPADVRTIYVAMNMSPILRMLMNTINVVATLMTGKPNVLVRDVREPLGKHGVRAPAQGSRYPGKTRTAA